MKKNGEDQPPKKVPSDADLARLANSKPRADIDTAYQDNKRKSNPSKKNIGKNK